MIEGIGEEPLRAVFIRAPWVEDGGPGRRGACGGRGPSGRVRDGNVLAVAFHPELTDDSRVHALFMAMRRACSARGGGRA